MGRDESSRVRSDDTLTKLDSILGELIDHLRNGDRFDKLEAMQLIERARQNVRTRFASNSRQPAR